MQSVLIDQGYAFEVCLAILEYARDNLPEVKLNCLIDRDNVPSIRLAKKLGFSYYGVEIKDGKTLDRYCN